MYSYKLAKCNESDKNDDKARKLSDKVKKEMIPKSK